jgi:hypothetical protein
MSLSDALDLFEELDSNSPNELHISSMLCEWSELESIQSRILLQNELDVLGILFDALPCKFGGASVFKAKTKATYNLVKTLSNLVTPIENQQLNLTRKVGLYNQRGTQ